MDIRFSWPRTMWVRGALLDGCRSNTLCADSPPFVRIIPPYPNELHSSFPDRANAVIDNANVKTVKYLLVLWIIRLCYRLAINFPERKRNQVNCCQTIVSVAHALSFLSTTTQLLNGVKGSKKNSWRFWNERLTGKSELGHPPRSPDLTPCDFSENLKLQ